MTMSQEGSSISSHGLEHSSRKENLDWSQRQGDKSIDPKSVETTAVQFPTAPQMNTHRWVILIALCGFASEALAVVKKGNMSYGLDARRRLTAEFDLDNPEANRQLLRRSHLASHGRLGEGHKDVRSRCRLRAESGLDCPERLVWKSRQQGWTHSPSARQRSCGSWRFASRGRRLPARPRLMWT